MLLKGASLPILPIPYLSCPYPSLPFSSTSSPPPPTHTVDGVFLFLLLNHAQLGGHSAFVQMSCAPNQELFWLDSHPTVPPPPPVELSPQGHYLLTGITHEAHALVVGWVISSAPPGMPLRCSPSPVTVKAGTPPRLVSAR